MNATDDGSGAEFVNHWDWAASKGLMPQETARALKVATSRILQIEGDGWESMDVRQMDIDSLLNRFEILAKKDFSPGSLSTYGSRFRRAHQLYLSYLQDPSAYRPATRAVKRDRARSADTARKPAAEVAKKVMTEPNGASSAERYSDAERDSPSYPDMVKYPFPVRPGVIAQLQLPVDLQKAEARRLCSFLDSLAVDSETSGLSKPEESA